MKGLCMVLCLLVVGVSSVMAFAAPSVEQGKALFNSTDLGTNGKRCATCHPNGKGLEEAAGYGKTELGVIINQCIKKPLEGRELALDSAEMQSLVMYVQSLAAPGKK